MIVVSREFSRKVRLLSFVAISSVVVIHAQCVMPSASAWNVFLQRFICDGLFLWPVPFFFMVSGFWFGCATRDTNPTLSWYSSVLRKKFQTLFVPYVLWAVVGACVTMVLVGVNNYCAGRSLLARTPFLGSGWLGAADSVFGVTVFAPWGCGVLWFLRVLLIFFVLSPVWLFLSRLSHWVTLVASGALLCSCYAGCGWVLLGFALSRFGIERIEFSRNRRTWLWTVGILLAAHLAMAAIFAASFAGWVRFDRELLRTIDPLVSIPILWIGFDLFSTAWCVEEVPWYCGYGFWIYVIHQLVASYWMAVCRAVFGYSDVKSLGIMVITPFVSFAISLSLGVFVRRRAPRIYSILTGGR